MKNKVPDNFKLITVNGREAYEVDGIIIPRIMGGANTLTNLIPILYQALDKVSRELTGFIPSVSLNASAEQMAKGQTVNIFTSEEATAYDITPATTPPDNGDTTPGNRTLSIDKSRMSPIRFNGEEQKALDGNGMLGPLHVARVAQAIRVLVNEVESDVGSLYTETSNAYGTVATIPFTTNLDESAQVLKMLLDNGAGGSDLNMVFNTTVGAKLRTLGQVTKANEAGGDDLLRRGILLDLHGIALRESAQVKTHTAGTGANYTSTDAGFAIGIQSIPIITGTGTVLAGDIVTFAGDLNKYTVKTGVAAPGTIVLEEPGLKQAIPAAATAMTIIATHTAAMAFNRDAITLALRTPAMPKEGTMASDVIVITDPNTGISLQVAIYPQYHQVKYEIGLAWGKAVTAPRHVVRLLH